jgi:hypothetical protein
VGEQPKNQIPDVSKVLGEAFLGTPEERRRLAGLANLRARDQTTRAVTGIDEETRKKLSENIGANAQETAETMRRAGAAMQRAELDSIMKYRRTNDLMTDHFRREAREKAELRTATLGTYDELTRLNYGIVALRRAQEEADQRQRETDATVVRLERENVLYARIGVLLAAATLAAVVVGTPYALILAVALGIVLFVKGAKLQDSGSANRVTRRL